MRVYEAMARELRRAGVERAFGLMGEDVAKLIIELDRVGIAYVAARHENQAVGMADGYARVSGKLGVALVTSGPGFTNALTLITIAARARSRVLVVVGGKVWNEDDPEAARLRPPKYYPVLPTCAAGEIAAVKPRNAAEAVESTRASIARALRGETVVLNVTTDLLESPAPVAGDDAREEAAPAAAPPVDPERLELVADLLQETWAVSRPVILAGAGAVRAGAAPALRRLGELTGALLATTLLARGSFDGDPFAIDVSGTFSTSLGAELLGQADTVIAVGASLNPFTTFAGTLFPQARVVQVDTDAAAFGRHLEVEPELALRGDAREVAERLVAELERRGHSSTGFRTPEVAERLASFDPLSDFSDRSLPGALDPRTLMAELDRILPRNRTVVVDPGHHCTFSTRYLRPASPQSFVWPFETGSIGVGVGEGIGATLGSTDGAIGVVAVGDGALMMALADVETAVRYRVPVVFVCSNDGALGAEVHFLDMIGQPTELATHSTPDLAAVAEALGAEGFAVRTLADLEPLRERFRRPLDGPVLLDCRVNPAIRGEGIEIVYGHHPGALRQEEGAIP
jgi:thiamine pyrophosphate-dependent acetolactate synthase large subunit-like protein